MAAGSPDKDEHESAICGRKAVKRGDLYVKNHGE